MDGTYLIWSHEHSAWWGPDGNGYTRRLSLAGRYTRTDALLVCVNAMPGAHSAGALCELPVPLDDVLQMVDRYKRMFPALPEEQWE